MADCPEGEQEHRLRVLLEHAVPDLPEPEHLLRRVRQLAVRRRRLRQASATTAAVLAAVSLSMVLHRSDPRPAEAGVRTGSSPAPSAALLEAHYPELAGLSVQLSGNWHRLTTPVVPAATKQTFFTREGFAGTSGDTRPVCKKVSDANGYCLPMERLDPGEGLATFSMVQTGKSGVTSKPGISTREASAVCRKLHGTSEVVSVRAVGPAEPGALLTALVCLNHPSERLLDQARSLLHSIRFDHAQPARQRPPV